MYGLKRLTAFFINRARQKVSTQINPPIRLFPLPVCVLQMMKRVYKGIPLQLRGQAWALLLEVDKVKQANYKKYEVGALAGQPS